MTATFADVCAVVPAAGFGRRMQTTCPKQYLYIGNKTILEHSVSVLLANPRVARVVIVINPKTPHFFTLPLATHPQITVVGGDIIRAGSVLAGVQAAGNSHWVLVHDAVRPCLHQKDVVRLLEISNTSCIGGILATPIHDTIKRAVPNKGIITNTIERVNLWRSLTPQLFPRKLLHDCLTHALQDGVTITDEASALEYCGLYPALIEGRSDNIKITHPEDFRFAEFYLSHTTYDEERA